MATKFFYIELYPHSDANSIRNIISEVLPDTLIKQVVELPVGLTLDAPVAEQEGACDCLILDNDTFYWDENNTKRHSRCNRPFLDA